jgi:type IV pilus assembly protein PilY1
MKGVRGSYFRFTILAVTGIAGALCTTPASAANLPQYCQYPPYVFQSVLPSVTLLVSNSTTMLQFAYPDSVNPANPCDNQANACGGYDPTKRYYGLFDPGYWYTGITGNNGGFTRANPISGNRGTDDWHGNFLNWLTTRRVDVMRRVLTGGTGDGTQLCGAGIAEWRKFSDNRTYTPFNAVDQVVHFPKQTNCTGTLLGNFVLGTGTSPAYNIQNRSVGTTSGIIQEMTPKASLGIGFYNDGDSQGASLDPQVDGSNIPIVAYRNRIDTPSRFNGMTVGQPLGEALWTIVGQYASLSATAATGPRYHTGDYVPSKDPYSFHGSPSRCVKGSVIVISDGEPCMDGALPSSFGGFDILHFADNTSLNCSGATCFANSSLGFPYNTTIPSCSVGGNTAGFEDVALFAHTTDLRGPSFGGDNLDARQNLDVYVIRAFGSDNSNLLKYGAINGTFEDVNGNGYPDPGEFSQSNAYYEAEDGSAIEAALRAIFENLLRRATSGTAASVLASGEGSGANLVQAVFYPRRRFFDEVIEWTGSLQNFWYYVDPFFGNSSIREESDDAGTETKKLNLVYDNTVTFFFDQTSQTTKANRYANNPATGNAYGTPTVVPFEEVMPIWEAGKFLHARSADSRRIFTVTGSYPKGIDNTTAFSVANRSYFSAYLGASLSDTDVTNIVRYVRGEDDVTGDGVPDFRQRTVPHPANIAADNTVWKLGDVINSTPRVVASIPLNTFHKVYNDSTYTEFITSAGYKNRGMVFVGANDGALHAFKLGKLEFPGDNTWSNPGVWDKARLRNLDTSGVPGSELGSERWAFIPKNGLPYLQAMQDNNYCHLYYVDLAPQVFDASIGSGVGDQSDNTRTANAWRTVLIGGMRYGGGCAPVSSGRANAVDIPIAGTGYSSYFAIDVTDPENPSVLWEFSNPSLGFSTTGPAIVRMNGRNAGGYPDRSLNGKWFVVFGSGPTGPIVNRQFLGRSDQTLKLFILDLKTGTLRATIDTTISNAFAGSMINATADVNLDYEDDAVYIPYVKENSGSWNQGGVLRLLTKGSTIPTEWAQSRVIDDVGPVTSSVVRLQNNTYHTNWLFFGTGRYYFYLPTALDDPTSQRSLFGVKDPCFGETNVIDPSCTTTVSAGDLRNIGDLTVIAESTANSPGFAGWRIDLDTASPVAYDAGGAKRYQVERVITDPLASSAGVVFFTTFRPYGDDCAIGGRTFLWAVRYNTGGIPPIALQGKGLMQVSTASVEQIDLGTAFSQTVSGADAALHRGGRRSFSMEGVPPMAQGLSLLSPPPPLKRILHMRER